MESKLKVLELYSGIGGMHYAVEESGLPAKVVAAIDINDIANKVYTHNFPSSILLQRNIMSLSQTELNALEPDVIMMSPPCQPFTRVGLKKDMNDERTNSFVHLLTILPDLKTVHYILMENVKGFETSATRNKLISTLEKSGFVYQEFLLSPHTFSIPNTRLRYYLIAKRKPKKFCFQVLNQLMTSLPMNSNSPQVPNEDEFLHSSCGAFIADLNRKLFKSFGLTSENSKCETFCIKQILEADFDENKFLLGQKTLARHAQILDIVTPEDSRSCCFTKAYGGYVEGTGSVLCPYSEKLVHQTYEQCKYFEYGSLQYVRVLSDLKIRYFTPTEVARLMCFPDTFSFPERITTKQKYRLLGNSINVHVVATLFSLLTCEQ